MLSPPSKRQNRHVAGIEVANRPKSEDESVTEGISTDSMESRAGQGGGISSPVTVIQEDCIGCGICAQVCPVAAILVHEIAVVDASRCKGCGTCVAECPQDALILGRA